MLVCPVLCYRRLTLVDCFTWAPSELDFGLWVKSGPMPVSVDKVLLNTVMLIHLCVIYGYFHSITVQLSS